MKNETFFLALAGLFLIFIGFMVFFNLEKNDCAVTVKGDLKEQIQENVKNNFKTIYWYDEKSFINNKYSEDDLWNLAYQISDIQFFIFEKELSESNLNVKLLKEELAYYIIKNLKNWSVEAHKEVEYIIKLNYGG